MIITRDFQFENPKAGEILKTIPEKILEYLLLKSEEQTEANIPEVRDDELAAAIKYSTEHDNKEDFRSLSDFLDEERSILKY